MNEVTKTLIERGNEYGCFVKQSEFSYSLKNLIHTNDGWLRLAPYQKESLDMIIVKISRIINGNPNKKDTWHDIAGYASLVEKSLDGVNL